MKMDDSYFYGLILFSVLVFTLFLLTRCAAIEPLVTGSGAAYSYHKFDTLTERVEKLEGAQR